MGALEAEKACRTRERTPGARFASRAARFSAIKMDGSLWAWGRNDVDLPGLEMQPYYMDSPTQVTLDSEAGVVACWEYTGGMNVSGGSRFSENNPGKSGRTGAAGLPSGARNIHSTGIAAWLETGRRPLTRFPENTTSCGWKRNGKSSCSPSKNKAKRLREEWVACPNINPCL